MSICCGPLATLVLARLGGLRRVAAGSAGGQRLRCAQGSGLRRASPGGSARGHVIGEEGRDGVGRAPQAREIFEVLAMRDISLYLVVSDYISLYLAVSLISRHIRARFCEHLRPGEGCAAGPRMDLSKFAEK